MPKRFHVKLRRSSNRGLNMTFIRQRPLLCRWGSIGSPRVRWRAGPLKRWLLGLRSVRRGSDPLHSELRQIQKLYAQGWEQPWMKVVITISWLLFLGLFFLNPLGSWLSMRSDAEQLVCPGPSCSLFQVD